MKSVRSVLLVLVGLAAGIALVIHLGGKDHYGGTATDGGDITIQAVDAAPSSGGSRDCSQWEVTYQSMDDIPTGRVVEVKPGWEPFAGSEMWHGTHNLPLRRCKR